MVWQGMPYFGLKKGGLALLSGVEGALLLAFSASHRSRGGAAKLSY